MLPFGKLRARSVARIDEPGRRRSSRAKPVIIDDAHATSPDETGPAWEGRDQSSFAS